MPYFLSIKLLIPWALYLHKRDHLGFGLVHGRPDCEVRSAGFCVGFLGPKDAVIVREKRFRDPPNGEPLWLTISKNL